MKGIDRKNRGGWRTVKPIKDWNGNTYTVEAKQKPKWYQFRLWVAFRLAKLAHWVYPECDEVKAFWLKVITDSMIYGKNITRVNWEEGVK